MNIGMLWYDNDPKTTLEAKIKKAASYYADKYGKQATTIFVNPKTIESEQVIDGITVKKHRSVMPDHFWVGVESTWTVA